MVTLSPSILAADFTRLGEELALTARAGADAVHYDVMDNHFVPNLSFGFEPLAAMLRVCRLPADVHLMIENPQASLDRFLAMRPTLLTIHLEACTDPGALLDAIRAAGCRAGLAIRPATPVEALAPWLDRLDLVLLMLVEPGFSGQAMLPETVAKIDATAALIRAQRLSVAIQIDGGVKADNFTALADRGARHLVMGSGFYQAADPAAVAAAVHRYTPDPPDQENAPNPFA